MSLFLHEFYHLILSLLPACIIFLIFNLKDKKNLLLLLSIGLLGGFFIDLDHLFDYFLAFGIRFRLDYFLKGYQFLKSDKIYIPLHSFEIVFLLLIIYYLVSIGFKKIKGFTTLRLNGLLALSFSLSLFFHIAFDTLENQMPPAAYSLTYRIIKKFELKELVYPDHYHYHLEQKKKIIFEN